MNKCRKKYIKLRLYLVCMACFYSCGSSVDNDASAVHIGFDNEIYKPRISIFQEKNMVIYATADKLEKDEGDHAVLSGNVISKFFNDNGEYMSTLYSDSAKVEEVTNNLMAWQHVRVEADSGKTLFSKKILWNNQYKLISSTDSSIFTRSNGDIINCVGFESDMDLTQIEFSNVWGSINDGKKK